MRGGAPHHHYPRPPGPASVYSAASTYNTFNPGSHGHQDGYGSDESGEYDRLGFDPPPGPSE
jgi:hypothetical protein